jgi:uncharacterized protein (TIGR02145 family)
MKRNLNVGIRLDGNRDQSDNGVLEKYCYGNSPETTCNTYGGLYQWDEAMHYSSENRAQGICPSGWHIPSDAEWQELEITLGMSQVEADSTEWRGVTEGDHLKKAGLCSDRTPCGSSGYDARLAGIRYTDGHWDNQGIMEAVWTSTLTSNGPWMRYLQSYSSMIFRNVGGKRYGHSIRCVMDQ